VLRANPHSRRKADLTSRGAVASAPLVRPTKLSSLLEPLGGGLEGTKPSNWPEQEKESGLNGTVEDYQHSDERAEVLLTRDQFFGILVVVW